MSDYLHNLVARALNQAESARPRAAMLFEPLQPVLHEPVREFFESVAPEEISVVEDALPFAESEPEQRQVNKSTKRVEQQWRAPEPSAEVTLLESSEAQEQPP